MKPWSLDIKASDDFLDSVFKRFFEKLKLPTPLDEGGYHLLAKHLKKDQVGEEIAKILGAIVEVAEKARPSKE
jgi:hypothetical protein